MRKPHSLKITAIFFALAVFFSSCSSTMISTVPEDADIYVKDEYLGKSPVKYTSMKPVFMKTEITIKKEGYEDFTTEIRRSERPRAGNLALAIVSTPFTGGLCWLWAIGYKKERTYKLESLNETPVANEVAPKEIPQAPDDTKLRGGGDPLKGLNVGKDKKLMIGKYYALVIGIDDYSGTWTKLDNAVNDAKAIEGLLKDDYQFDQVFALYNEQATRKNIITKLEWLIKNAKEDDNVLIFYSGHGDFKQNLNKGFWVPIDAKTSSTSEFISNSDIQTYLGGMKSNHTLLVSDACFSGDIFRGNTLSVPFESSERYYKEVYKRKSRQALTSGGVEPVMDGGRDGHSVFTYYFIKALKENESKYFDASQIFDSLKIPVVNNSEQTPNLSAIKKTGDEGGQFIFIKK